MKIITHLHFYQPHNQQLDILDRIVNESYRPLTEGILANPRSKVVINISGVLLNLLSDNGYEDVVDNIKKILSNGQGELTGSAMYHALLPLLPKEEIQRQIEQNESECEKYFGDLFQPLGFFLPEMAVNEKALKSISENEYKWVGVPQISHPDNNPSCSKFYIDSETGLNLFFRNKRVSALVLSAVVQNAEQLIKETQELHATDEYWYLVMDAETFGHHRIGHQKVLFDIMNHDFFEPILVKELLKDVELPEEKVEIRPSTWTNEEQDFWLDKDKTKGTTSNSFILWDDPSNPIHRVQWKLTNYVIESVGSFGSKDSAKWNKAREELDKAIASDQYWWASAKPWWSLEMLEQGAHALKSVINTLYGKDSEEYSKADTYYREILDLAFKWQREGVIRKKHLENSSTFMKAPFKNRTPTEWFNVILVDLEAEMLRAAEEKNYEEAIKWRDAIYKLHQETDIYDVLHVVDEFWTGRKIMFNKPLRDKDWEEISDFIKGYLKDINTKEDFENWKKQSKLS